MKPWKIVLIIVLCFVGELFVVVPVFNDRYEVKIIEKIRPLLPPPRPTERDIDKRIIALDLDDFGISKWKQERLISTMDQASLNYGIPLILLHMIFYIESTYRTDANHQKVPVLLNKRSQIVQAVGLGGVVWEFWGDSLRANNIADSRDDLKEFEKNIPASAFILRKCIESSIPVSTPLTLFDEIIKRYYGAYNVDYKKKMMEVTSRLWLNRISHDILSQFKQEKRIQSASTPTKDSVQ